MADIEEQIAFLLEVRDRISAISAQAILARGMREPLEAHHKRWADEPGREELSALGGKVDLSLFFPPICLTALRFHSYAADPMDSIAGMLPGEL